MRFQTIASSLALAGTTFAFSDSSPWVLLSTSSFDDAPGSNQIQTNSQVKDFTESFLKKCPTSRYLVIDQPGMTVADIGDSNGCTMSSLCSVVEDTRNKAKFVVSEVIGDVSISGFSDHIKNSCEDKDVTVEAISLASPSASDRPVTLSENNAIIGDKIAEATADDSYTILFLSSLGEATNYEADFNEPVQMELKKRIQNTAVRREEAKKDNRPLFEKYQFFTPGIFMGIIAAIIIFSILGVGLKALSSLEVSYGAFTKDMGPAAQKKQQ